MWFMDNKGQTLDNLYPAVLTIVIIGILLGIGIFVLNQSQEAMSTVTHTVYNETLATVDEAGETVTTASNCGFHDMAVLYITAEENSSIIPTGNYTTLEDSGVILGATLGPTYPNATNWNVTYTYLGASDTSTTGYCGAMTVAVTGVGGLASWIAVIVVVLAAAIVLGIVIRSFGRKSAV